MSLLKRYHTMLEMGAEETRLKVTINSLHSRLFWIQISESSFPCPPQRTRRGRALIQTWPPLRTAAGVKKRWPGWELSTVLNHPVSSLNRTLEWTFYLANPRLQGRSGRGSRWKPRQDGGSGEVGSQGGRESLQGIWIPQILPE